MSFMNRGKSGKEIKNQVTNSPNPNNLEKDEIKDESVYSSSLIGQSNTSGHNNSTSSELDADEPSVSKWVFSFPSCSNN
jgi:hypothetical protein